MRNGIIIVAPQKFDWSAEHTSRPIGGLRKNKINSNAELTIRFTIKPAIKSTRKTVTELSSTCRSQRKGH